MDSMLNRRACTELQLLAQNLYDDLGHTRGAIAELARILGLSYSNTHHILTGYHSAIGPRTIEGVAQKIRVPAWIFYMTDEEFIEADL